MTRRNFVTAVTAAFTVAVIPRPDKNLKKVSPKKEVTALITLLSSRGEPLAPSRTTKGSWKKKELWLEPVKFPATDLLVKDRVAVVQIEFELVGTTFRTHVPMTDVAVQCSSMEDTMTLVWNDHCAVSITETVFPFPRHLEV